MSKQTHTHIYIHPQAVSLLRKLNGHSRAVTCVAISGDSKHIASGGSDHTVRLWDAGTGRCLHTLQGHQDDVDAVDMSRNGKWLGSCSKNSILVWVLRNGADPVLLHTLTGENVYDVKFSPDGNRMASASAREGTIIWSVQSGNQLWTCRMSSKCVAWSRDGKLVAAGNYGGHVQVFNADAGTELCRSRCHTNPVNCVMFGTATSLLASPGQDLEIVIWKVTDASNLTVQKTLRDHSGYLRSTSVQSISFSPQDAVLASGGDRDTCVMLWDMATGKWIKDINCHSHVTSVAWSPDGQFIVNGGSDGNLYVWDTRQVCTTFRF